MRVLFVHGWSVTNTDTYGGLPAALRQQIVAGAKLQVTNLDLAKYVSFSDEIKVDDIARGMQQALEDVFGRKLRKSDAFACITHSTGGPVVRQWIDLHYRRKLASCPLRHLIMLAPANHGSALATLGKGKLSRLKSFVLDGVQPGTGVLDWLELGSDQGWALNRAWLDYDCVKAGLFPFVLTGQRIDRALYDNLNSYTDEAGSDGVVRVAAANLNYRLLRLTQQDGELVPQELKVAPPTAFGVLPGRSHSGEKIGILRSVRADDTPDTHPTLRWVIDCLQVTSRAQYDEISANLAKLTDQTQAGERVEKVAAGFIFTRKFTTSRYCMLVFRIVDDRGNELDDYDLLFTAGPNYDPNHLPPGFFVDRQRNALNRRKLTYYLDHDVMAGWFAQPEVGDKFGVRVVARPADGYAHYVVAEHRSTFTEMRDLFAPNQTLMIEILLQRHVRQGTYRLAPFNPGAPPENFSQQPKGDDLRPGL
ncbi:MAG: hypothetical protein WDM96_10445 [Lacunisphaera sp.]